MPDRPPWNHNVHYHRLVVEALPRPCHEALDVGCGEGMLVRRLAGHVEHVTGIDTSPAAVRAARAAAPSNATFVEADFLSAELPAEHYDFIAAVASLHHMDHAGALRRMAHLLRPGGRLVVIGLARSRSPVDFAIGAAGLAASRLHRVQKGWWEPEVAIVEPELSWRQVRAASRATLPDVRYRRRLLWRYSLVWERPCGL
jgi:SAM-dependent methyltransferase